MSMSSDGNERIVSELGGGGGFKSFPAGAYKKRLSQVSFSPSSPPPKRDYRIKRFLRTKKPLNVFSDHNLFPTLVSKLNRGDVLVRWCRRYPQENGGIRNPHRRGPGAEEK